MEWYLVWYRALVCSVWVYLFWGFELPCCVNKYRYFKEATVSCAVCSLPATPFKPAYIPHRDNVCAICDEWLVCVSVRVWLSVIGEVLYVCYCVFMCHCWGLS